MFQNESEESNEYLYKYHNESSDTNLTDEGEGGEIYTKSTDKDEECYQLGGGFENNNEFTNASNANATITKKDKNTNATITNTNTNANTNKNTNKNKNRYNHNRKRRDDHDGDDASVLVSSPPTGVSGTLGQRLCWRLNPAESLSDWKLKIFNRSTKDVELFHVHRVVLAVGPRGCEYFQDVFRQDETEKTANATSRVPLIASSCKLVPYFLDYVYGNEKFEIKSSNALGLCYLADLFRNHSLWDRVTDYIEDDLGTANGKHHLCQYYIDAVYYDQDEFLDHILSVCARDLLSMMDENISCTNLLREINPGHLCQILVEMEPSTELSLTNLITEYCSIHRDDLTMELFDHFTSRLLVLNLSSAITLLEASLEYDIAPCNGPDTSQDSCISSLILFQQQCIGTLSESWEELLEIDQERVTWIMRTLSSREEQQSILVDWFQKTLIRASNQLSVLREEKKVIQQECITSKDQYKTTKHDLQKTREEVSKEHRNHASTKSEMKTQISSWMRKNEGTNRQQERNEQKWENERMQWRMKYQRWKHEKSKMKHELKELRSKLSLTDEKKSCDPPRHRIMDDHGFKSSELYASNNDADDLITFIDDFENDITLSFVTNASSENNSLANDLEGDAERNGYGYSTVDGMTPKFRIL